MSKELKQLAEDLRKEIRQVRDLFDLRREIRLAREEREAALREEVQSLREEMAALRETVEQLQAVPTPAPYTISPQPSSTGGNIWFGPNTVPYYTTADCGCVEGASCGRTDCTRQTYWTVSSTGDTTLATTLNTGDTCVSLDPFPSGTVPL